MYYSVFGFMKPNIFKPASIVFQGLFRQGVAANFLFIVCEKLHLPYQVKFVAIELFDR